MKFISNDVTCLLVIQASEGLNVKELCIRALLSGLCFHSYQQVRSNDSPFSDEISRLVEAL